MLIVSQKNLAADWLIWLIVMDCWLNAWSKHVLEIASAFNEIVIDRLRGQNIIEYESLILNDE